MVKRESDRYEDRYDERIDKGSARLNPLSGKTYSRNYYHLLKTREALPAWSAKESFLKVLYDNPIVLVVGETGSGKTTQLPAQGIAVCTPGKLVGCTQPRRVAATSVATRVAQELDCNLGEEVGYSVRFEEKSSEKTRLKYLTEGMLVREAIKDPLLNRYGIVFLDEAHERNQDTDLLMGLLKGLTQKRPDFKLVVMTATMQQEKFKDYFNAPLLRIPGRMYPVATHYTQQPVEDYVSDAVKCVCNIHKTEEAGDILVFLPGEVDIYTCIRKIENANVRSRNGEQLFCLPLHGSLQMVEQLRVFESCPGRKCVVATNIAETSLTIDGIVYVVDSGFHKQDAYIPKKRVRYLVVTPISQSSADQRSGRAGRTRAGKAFRLFPERVYLDLLEPTNPPEVKRSCLEGLILTMKRLGIKEVAKFDFIDTPTIALLSSAMEQLTTLGALTPPTYDLSELGTLMSEFPLDPRSARMILKGEAHGCTMEMLAIAAMLNVPPLFRGGKRGEDGMTFYRFHNSDHITYLTLFLEYLGNQANEEHFHSRGISFRALVAARQAFQQLLTILKRLTGQEEFSKCVTTGKIDDKSAQKAREGLAEGFFMNAARFDRPSGKYKINKSDIQAVPHQSSSLVVTKPKYLLYNEMEAVSEDFKLRCCSEVELNWLVSAAPTYYHPVHMPEGPVREDIMELVRNGDIELN